MEILKVAKETNINKLAGSIANNLRNDGEVAICMIGAQSINQTIKGCIIARRYLKEENKDLYIQPDFFDTTSTAENRVTGIQFTIKVVNLA